MKSKIAIAATAGIYTLIIFSLGFAASFTINILTLANSYAKDHVDNGRFLLSALTLLEEGKTEEAKRSLRGHVSAKVNQVDMVRLLPTSQREVQVINDFYREVVHFNETYGGFYETTLVLEDGEWVSKPSQTTTILREFSASKQNKAL